MDTIELKLVGVEGDLSRDSLEEVSRQLHNLERGKELTEELLNYYHEEAWKIIEANGGARENMGSNAMYLLQVLGNYRASLRASLP